MNPELLKKLEPLPGSDNHCWYYFDDEVLLLQVPCSPRPKGSASPVARLRKDGTPYVGWRAGSDAKASGLMKEQENKIRDATALLWKLGFVPYDEGCVLDLDVIMVAPKARLKEDKHLCYPDRDKLLRAVQDMISPSVVNRTPQLQVPHLVVNDSQIYAGYTKKHWLHSWNKETGMDDDESSIYISLRP